jgi:hypothetical protein
MSWSEIENRGGRRRADGVTVALRVDANGQKAALRIGADVVEEARLGGLALAAGGTVSLWLGAGADRGKLRLRAANAGWKLQRATANKAAAPTTAVTLTLAVWEIDHDESLPAAPAAWRLAEDGTALEIDLPREAWPVERARVSTTVSG